ncbi:MAG: PepSY-associated TM helix domain-containing protein [Bacteroidales bacterium]|jgi:hypothetical protein|nr:PepSY-associated TM helix domain-containing protein [Bacteroidales bacterium]
MNLYRLNRILHRDFGYFFFGMTIIYAVSGVALNHRHQWNSNYIIRQETIDVSLPENREEDNRSLATYILDQVPGDLKYRTELSSGNNLKIFVDGGSVSVNLSTGQASVETIRKRPIFNGFNFLHYNKPGRLWTWFSDLYCLGLLLLAVTGLFIIKGKNGIKGRGAWMTAIGIVIPLILFLIYM